VVDAIQALGCVPIDVREAGVDILATGGHKWLCGPFGTGFAYLRRGLVERIEPRTVGWTAMKASADYADCCAYRWELVDDARRFEVATQPFQDVAAFTRSLELLLEVGQENVHAHVLSILDPLAEWLAGRDEAVIVSDLHPARRSGIFAFRFGDTAKAYGALHRAGVQCVLREGAIRLSPHLYNTAEDVAAVIGVLERGGW
jgi:selenocysteine lyase/cysteine desulfurase